MSKYNIFHPEHDGLASDRLIENAEAMLVLLKHMIAATYQEDGQYWPTDDFDHMVDRAKTITQYIETGA
jgi:hypothetical protein